MSRSRFTPTRVVLVALLVGGVYKVSTLVTQPPVGPPQLPKAAPAASKSAATTPTANMSQAEIIKAQKDRMATQQKQFVIAQQREALEKKLNHGKMLANDDGITPEYFRQTSMGSKGFTEAEQHDAIKKRITDEVNKQMASKMAGLSPTKPEGTPPTTTAPPAPIKSNP